MTFLEGPDAHEIYCSKTFRKKTGGGEWRCEGIFFFGKIKSICGDPILCIVIKVIQNFMHSKSQSQTFFHYYALLKNPTIDHYISSFTIGLDSYPICSSSFYYPHSHLLYLAL